jgi:hypothetical protein
MNEFEMMQKILDKHDQVEKLLRVNDRMYEHLAASILYITRYADKNGIALPNKEALDTIVNTTIACANDVNEVSKRISLVAKTELSLPPTTTEQPKETTKNRAEQIHLI